MNTISRGLADIKAQLTVPVSLLQDIATRFQMTMCDALSGKPSSLKMLPSFMGIPSGQEQGTVIAVDFGGTNVRILLIALNGAGQAKIIAKKIFPLKDKGGKYDYMAASVSGMQLFDFIAGNITEIAPKTGDVYPMGHTFSFPCRQYGVNQAELINWTKEFKTTGVEGQNIGELMQSALDRQGLGHIQAQVIINDTTGTLLTAAYTDNTTDIGAICGTGHNSCYLEPNHPLTQQPMIVNMESGNFDQIPQTSYDACLDANSEKLGQQRLEKMVSGRYLGEIVRLIVSGLVKDGYLTAAAENIQIPYSLTAEDISAMLADHTQDLEAVADIAASRWDMSSLVVHERTVLKTIAGLVVTRSARLVAATWAGVLYKIDPDLSRHHTIAVDGSLYEKMPGYSEDLAQAMKDMLGEAANQVTIRLSKDGSGIGAAIAAATVYGSS
ncbi:MAG: Hexokinase [Firmicutes bacterium]|nr:Hexokinase [Bacillota bacterium]